MKEIETAVLAKVSILLRNKEPSSELFNYIYKFCFDYSDSIYSIILEKSFEFLEEKNFCQFLNHEFKRIAFDPSLNCYFKKAFGNRQVKELLDQFFELSDLEKCLLAASIDKSYKVKSTLNYYLPTDSIQLDINIIKQLELVADKKLLIKTIESKGLTDRLKNKYLELKDIKMEGIAGTIESLKGDFTKLQSSLPKGKINEKELANITILTTLHSEWDSRVVAEAIKDKVSKVSWDKVNHEVASSQNYELNVPNVANVVSLLKFLEVLNKDAITAFLLYSWNHPTTSANLAKHAAEAAHLKQFSFNSINPIIIDSSLSNEDSKVWNSQVPNHEFNSKSLFQALFKEIGDEQVFNWLNNQVQDGNAFFIILGAALSDNNKEANSKIIAARALQTLVFQPTAVSALAFKQLYSIDSQFFIQLIMHCNENDAPLMDNVLYLVKQANILDELLNTKNFEFALDIALLADKNDVLTFEKYLGMGRKYGVEFTLALLEFLEKKLAVEGMAAENTKSRKCLNLRSTYATLTYLSTCGNVPAELSDRLNVLQVQCVQMFPRLINFGQGHDAAILSHGGDNNTFPEKVESEMKMYYQKMYATQMGIRDIITMLQRLKQSDIPSEQDVFACMIHSLFDEYRFFPEYPLNALATTAVLFGSLIHFQLINGTPLQVALKHVLECLRSPPENNMFKFGLQALIEFQDRLRDFPTYCRLLSEIQGIQTHHPQLFAQIQDIVNNTDAPHGSNPNNGFVLAGQVPPPPGISTTPQEPTNNFQSVACYISNDNNNNKQVEPNEQVADKVLFIVNNIASNNVNGKTQELKKVLEEQYYRWFANYIVGQRSKQEPNYHQLYINMISLLDAKLLELHFVETSYMHIIQVLNATDFQGTPDRKTQLKNLGQWLGSLLLARDKPILHKNIYFKGLLYEGYKQDKLELILPFVCKTLEKAVDSTVFAPPNPWLMGICYVLNEIYYHADLKLQLKFEIEVLFRAFDMKTEDVEVGQFIRNKPGENAQAAELVAGLERLRVDQLPPGLATSAPNAVPPPVTQQSLPPPPPQQQQQQQPQPQAQAQQQQTLPLPPLPPQVSNNQQQIPTTGTPTNIEEQLPIALVGNTAFVNHPALRRLFTMAIDKALNDVLQPVLERSVSIATTATKELVSKDYALEPDEGKMRVAAQQMVRALAGNLAAVSSKDLLAESLVAHLRSHVIASGYGEHKMVLDQVSIAVSDNLELVSSFVEKHSVDKAMAEVDDALSASYAIRAHHRDSRSNQFFSDPHVANKYNLQLPEPFALRPGGLVPQQLHVYEQFGEIKPQEEIPEPVEDQSPQALDNIILQMQSGVEQLERQVNECQETSLQELTPEHAVMALIGHLITTAARSPFKEQVVLKASQITVSSLFTATKSQLGREVLCYFLHQLCDMSAATAKEVVLWLIYSDDERKYDVDVIATLIRAKLITAYEIDVSLAKQILEKHVPAIEFAQGLIKKAVLEEDPCALRTEFTACLEAMENLAKNNENEKCNQVLEDLDQTQSENEQLMSLKEQMSMIFAEWLRLVQHPSKTDRSMHVFVYRLGKKGILSSEDYLTRLIRNSLEAAVSAALHVQGSNNNQTEAFVAIDALAKLIVTIFRTDSADLKQRVHYSRRAFGVISLVFAREHDTKLEQFNGRPYFRLFSTILYEMTSCENNFDEFFQEIYMQIAGCLQSLQPMAFPAFTFAWMTLVSHRLFLPKLMKLNNKKGQKLLINLLESLIRFVGEYSTGTQFPEMVLALYKGIQRIFLVILSDFPVFLIENHYALCNVIPQSFVQLRNVVLSAFPPNSDLPDPLTQGLKVDRLPQVRASPVLAYDPSIDLQSFGVKKLADNYLKNPSQPIAKCLAASLNLNKPVNYAGIGFDKIYVNVPAINALVLYIAVQASSEKITQNNTSSSSSSATSGEDSLFIRESNYMNLLNQLLVELTTEGRFFLFEAMADQLRFPNRHAHFYSCALLSIFGGHYQLFGDKKIEIQQLITRVLLERIICNRPHPWGLIITFTELLKNQTYKFWELSFIKSSPEFERMFTSLYDHLSNGARQNSVAAAAQAAATEA